MVVAWRLGPLRPGWEAFVETQHMRVQQDTRTSAWARTPTSWQASSARLVSLRETMVEVADIRSTVAE